MKKFLFVFMSFFVLNFCCFNVYASENPEDVSDVEYEVINVDALFNGRSTVSVMQIEGGGLDFDEPWKKGCLLYYSTDDVIVGEIEYGYENNQIFCKAYSYLYSHSAKIQVDKTVYTSSAVAAWKPVTLKRQYSSAIANSWFEFGIELYNAETGDNYYFGVAFTPEE